MEDSNDKGRSCRRHAYLRAVAQRGAHAYQAAVLNRAGVEQCRMPCTQHRKQSGKICRSLRVETAAGVTIELTLHDCSSPEHIWGCAAKMQTVGVGARLLRRCCLWWSAKGRRVPSSRRAQPPRPANSCCRPLICCSRPLQRTRQTVLSHSVTLARVLAAMGMQGYHDCTQQRWHASKRRCAPRTSQNRAVPDRRPVAELHIADDGGSRRNEDLLTQLRLRALKWQHRLVS